MCTNINCRSLGPHRYRRVYDKAQLSTVTTPPDMMSAASRQYPVQIEPQEIARAASSSQLKESASKDWLRSRKLFAEGSSVPEKTTTKSQKGWSTEADGGSKAKVSIIAGVVALIIIGAGVFFWGLNLNVHKTASPSFPQHQSQPQPPSQPSVASIAPPTISNIAVSEVTDSSVIITWVTNEPSTTQVEYGTTIDYGKSSVLNGELTNSHKVQLSSLSPSTTYHYKVMSKNASGKLAVSPSGSTFSTAAPPDTTAPIISGISVLDISDTAATIVWTTNEKATSQVSYGTGTADSSATTLNKTLVTNHTVTISGLEPDRTYYFRIKSKDANENEATSDANQSFKTLPPIPTGPMVGKRAPDFTVYTLNGEAKTLSKLRGKIVMVNFWAISCGACIAEMPYIEAVYKTWSGPKEFELLAINAGDHDIYIKRTIEEEKWTMPIFVDSDRTALSSYQISWIPRTFFIDSTGIIRKIEVGRFDNPDQIREALNALQ